MADNRVRTELARVEAELAEALADQAMLTVRIEGLKGQEAALRQLVAADRGHGRAAGEIMRMTKGDAIVAVVDRPMRIKEIVAALHAAGRTQEVYNTVSIYLTDLIDRKRLVRLSHGVYGPA